MKKFTKVLLALTLIAALVVPTAMSSFAAELTINPDGYYGNSANTGCGFLDGNMYITEGLKGDSIADLSVTVNGNTAYFNNGYLGVKHCALNEADYGDAGKVAGGWLQIGVVGADVVSGTNTMVVTDKEGNTVSLNFDATINALGTSYAKVVGDAEAKTMKAEIVFNTDPGFEVGTTFEGRCHDDHNSTGVFTVTAYDEATKMYTIESTNFVTTQSLLELKVTSEGTYKGYFVSATINEYNAYAGSQIAGTKITITEATCNRTNKPGSNLIDGTVEKVEGNPPSESDPVVITFKTADAVTVNTMMLYTAGDDASYNNRAPGAFKLYGVAADGTETLIKDVADSGMQNVNYAPFAVDIDATAAYSEYKMVITSMINGGSGSWWFQLGELEIYSDDAAMTDIYEVKTGAVSFNGTEPKAPETTPDPTPDPKPAPTGDSVVALVVLSVVSLLGMAVISKKRA
ncbi:MAG: hypothetical protein J6R82_07880 [Clostridia bacterium]|nr:hypothetical protein [Clostridia bacterium]